RRPPHPRATAGPALLARPRRRPRRTAGARRPPAADPRRDIPLQPGHSCRSAESSASGGTAPAAGAGRWPWPGQLPQPGLARTSGSGVTSGSWPVSACREQVPGGGVMARIPQAELTGIYGAMVKRMSRKMFGEVPEPVGVVWHNRKVLNFGFGVGRKVQKWDQCDENLKSFAHMAVASLVGCSFCLDYGYLHAHNQGLDVAKAREVPR